MHCIQSFHLMTRRCFTPYRALREIILQSSDRRAITGMSFQFLFNRVQAPRAVSLRRSHGSFYDMQSLDVVADPVNHGGTKLLE